jgi:hypothetical protein
MRNQPNCHDDAIFDVANQLGMDLQSVEEIVNFIWGEVRGTIEEGEFKGIRLPFFGLFAAKPFRVWAINNPELARRYNRGEKVDINIKT